MSSQYNKIPFTPTIKICERCGGQYLVTTKQQFNLKKYCSKECYNEAHNEQVKRNRTLAERTKKREEKERQKAFDEVLGPVLSPEAVTEDLRHRKKKDKDSRDYLQEDAMAARSRGLSYGQYTKERYAPKVYIPEWWRKENGYS